MWGDDMKEFTEKHKQVLDYITRSVDAGVPPSVREVCDAMGFRSTSTGHKYIKELEQMGYIAVDAGRNRNIRLLRPDTDRVVQVPLIGTVAARLPTLADQDFERGVPFVAGRHDPRELFALRVKGDSMVEAAILDGDIIVARQTPVAENGEIVVALVGEEATVKTFYKEEGHFRLQPENHTMAPIIVDRADILGKVIAVLRNYE